MIEKMPAKVVVVLSCCYRHLHIYRHLLLAVATKGTRSRKRKIVLHDDVDVIASSKHQIPPCSLIVVCWLFDLDSIACCELVMPWCCYFRCASKSRCDCDCECDNRGACGCSMRFSPQQSYGCSRLIRTQRGKFECMTAKWWVSTTRYDNTIASILLSTAFLVRASKTLQDLKYAANQKNLWQFYCCTVCRDGAACKLPLIVS